MITSPLSGSATAASRPYSFHSHNAAGNVSAREISGSALLAEEVPLTIRIHGVMHSVMMISPVQVDDFVAGFALAEGLISDISELLSVQLSRATQPALNITADLQLAADNFRAFLLSQRNARRGTSSCGLCGSDSLNAVFPELPRGTGKPFSLPDEDLRELLKDQQILGRESGAVHAAMLLNSHGEVLLLREDIGRHNALDKVIGAALRQHTDLSTCAVLMSSRCSTELIVKAARAGLSTLIHLAAPSTLAVQMAAHYNLGLIQIPRCDSARIFHQPGTLPGTTSQPAQE